MKNKLRHIIKSCLPHGYIVNRKRNRFLNDYDTWKRSGNSNITFDSHCIFDSFVTIDGYGCSGSSAIMDLLREYDTCTVWASKPAYASNTESMNGGIYGEFDLCRHTGGLLYIEHMMKEEAWVNDFWADNAVKNFIQAIYYSDIYQNYPSTRPLFFTFFEHITDQRIRCSMPQLNVWQHRFTGLNDIFTLKKMSKTEYYELCRHFLYSLFNMLFADKISGKTLVLDHIFGDCGDDMSRFEPYLPNIKRIIVTRDVRAVYVHACQKNTEWLAHDSVEAFVKWERKMHYRSKHESDNNTLELQFEDIMLNYDREGAKVEQFLGFTSQHHTARKTYLNPEISKSNVFSWRDDKLYATDCDRIKELIPEYCYG